MEHNQLWERLFLISSKDDFDSRAHPAREWIKESLSCVNQQNWTCLASLDADAEGLEQDVPAGAESGHGEGDEDQDQQPEDAPKNAAGAASLAHFESIFFSR